MKDRASHVAWLKSMLPAAPRSSVYHPMSFDRLEQCADHVGHDELVGIWDAVMRRGQPRRIAASGTRLWQVVHEVLLRKEGSQVLASIGPFAIPTCSRRAPAFSAEAVAHALEHWDGSLQEASEKGYVVFDYVDATDAKATSLASVKASVGVTLNRHFTILRSETSAPTRTLVDDATETVVVDQLDLIEYGGVYGPYVLRIELCSHCGGSFNPIGCPRCKIEYPRCGRQGNVYYDSSTPDSVLVALDRSGFKFPHDPRAVWLEEDRAFKKSSHES